MSPISPLAMGEVRKLRTPPTCRDNQPCSDVNRSCPRRYRPRLVQLRA